MKTNNTNLFIKFLLYMGMVVARSLYIPIEKQSTYYTSVHHIMSSINYIFMSGNILNRVEYCKINEIIILYHATISTSIKGVLAGIKENV